MYKSFSNLLNIISGDVISLIGGGGKTTSMLTLTQELSKKNSVMFTTSTRIGNPDPEYYDESLYDMDFDQIKHLILKNNDTPHRKLVFKYIIDEFHIKGIEKEEIDYIARHEKRPKIIIVEADGAKMLPLKAHAEFEPVLPETTTKLIPVIGIDSLHKPLLEENVHRSELFSKFTGLEIGQNVSIDSIYQIFKNKKGYLKDVANGIEIIPYISKINDSSKNDGIKLAEKLLTIPRINKVIVGNIREENHKFYCDLETIE